MTEGKIMLLGFIKTKANKEDFSEADYKVLTYEELLKVNGAKGGSGATGPSGPSSGAGNSSSGKDKGKTGGNNSKSGSSSNGGKGGAKGGQNAPSNTESHQTAPSDSNTSNTNGGQSSTSESQPGNTAGTNETSTSSSTGRKDSQGGNNYVENSHEGVANAKPGDKIVRDNGTEVVLNQGDINYAKEQIRKNGSEGVAVNTSGNAGGVSETGANTGSGTSAGKSSGSGKNNSGNGMLTPPGINPHNPQGGNAVSGTSAGKKSESGTINYESGHGTQPEVEPHDTYGKKGENELADGCSTESKKNDQEKVSLTPPGINPYDPYGKNEEHSENSATNDDYKIGNETTADTYTENDKGDDAPRCVENSDEGVANARPGDWIIRKGGDKAILTKGDIDAAREKVYGSSSVNDEYRIDNAKETENDTGGVSYTKQRDFSKSYGEKFGNHACGATSLLNEISEQYTIETGKKMTQEQKDKAMAAAVNSGHISDSDAYVSDWALAANDMANAVGLEGKYTYAKNSNNASATIYAIDKDGNDGVDHFVNDIGNGLYYDPWTGQTGYVSDLTLATSGLGGTRQLTYSSKQSN